MKDLKEKLYHCPWCRVVISTRVPTKDLVGGRGYWDSMITCPFCRRMYFKKVFPDGRVYLENKPAKAAANTSPNKAEKRRRPIGLHSLRPARRKGR